MQSLKLLSGYHMPVIGLGTARPETGDVTEAVRTALELGYRHIDTAHLYGSEPHIGVALNSCFNEGLVEREEIFITSKLWLTMMRPDLVRGACQQSLKTLGIDYLDLYLIHAPFPFKEGDKLFPTNDDGSIIASDVDYLDTWQAMEELVDAGLVRSIGVSNFNISQLQRVWDNARIKPSVLQIEVHPYCKSVKLVDFARSLGVQVTAFAPLGSPDNSSPTPEQPDVMNDKVVATVAARHKKSPAQVLLRYGIDRGLIVIPRTFEREYLSENFEVLQFQLSKDEIEELNAIPIDQRVHFFPWALRHRFYPFKDEC